jgi:hypothetical protein
MIEHKKDLLTEIRIAYAALLKRNDGHPISDRELEALDYVYPLDVTQILLNEIDNLNKQNSELFHQNTVLKEEFQHLKSLL